MTDSIPARLTALKTTPLPELKAQWRDLFGTEPPGYNRRFLESRSPTVSRRSAYGGLKPDTIKRLEALGEQLARSQRHPPPHPPTTQCRSPAPGCSASGGASSRP